MADIPFFIDDEKAPSLQLAEGINTSILTGMHGEPMMIVRHNIDPGAEAPMHAHPQEQVGLVFEGEGLLTIGDERRKVKRGDYYCMPSNIPHGVVNTGESTLQMIEVFHPIREDFLDKIK
ncbi:MAG: cupin domain-containing protein [candidate division Zixibacteria bacterium]|nr:cupin domain-containing protein [candidate division Zixibacteria bacterium]